MKHPPAANPNVGQKCTCSKFFCSLPIEIAGDESAAAPAGTPAACVCLCSYVPPSCCPPPRCSLSAATCSDCHSARSQQAAAALRLLSHQAAARAPTSPATSSAATAATFPSSRRSREESGSSNSTCGPIPQRTTSTSSTVEALAGRAGRAAGRRSRPSRTRRRCRRWPSAVVAGRRRRGPRASPPATRHRSLDRLPHCSTPASTPPTTPSGSAPGCPSPTRSSAPDAAPRPSSDSCAAAMACAAASPPLFAPPRPTAVARAPRPQTRARRQWRVPRPLLPFSLRLDRPRSPGQRRLLPRPRRSAPFTAPVNSSTPRRSLRAPPASPPPRADRSCCPCRSRRRAPPLCSFFPPHSALTRPSILLSLSLVQEPPRAFRRSLNTATGQRHFPGAVLLRR
jgi:hypothetical protein